MIILVILLVLLGVNTIFNLTLRFLALKGLQCRRSFSVPAAHEGETAEVIEVVRNDRPLLVPWLRLESRISSHLHFGRQENLGVSGEMYHRSLFMLMPYQQITRRHKVRLAKRGSYDIGNATLTAGDLLGFTCASTEQHESVPILVYPRLLDPSEVPAPFYRLLGETIVPRQLLQDPFLVNGIRPYQFRDNVRDIHWAATARTGELQVRTHDFTAQTRLMVVVNAQLTYHQWGNLMEYEQGPVEYAISMAATLCTQVLKSGLPCGFAANMPTSLDDNLCTVLPPSSGAAREEELLSAMAHLKVRFIKNFHEFLDELMDMNGVDFLLITAYTCPEIEERIEELRLRGNTVHVHLLDKEVAA
ncbi:MAG: DUF58 domain-containing protein [Clostridia bacterium]|nr:DUF58 domain-containing protein [Clostridia bacterium]